MDNATFLIGYALLILIVIGICWSRNSKGASPDAPLPIIPERPDPYSFAWLRGSVNEAIRLGVYDLIRSGLMEVKPRTRKMGWFSSTIDTLAPAPLSSHAGLHPVAGAVHARALPNLPISDLFSGVLNARITPLFTNVRQQAEDDGLIHSATTRRAAWLRLAAAAAFIVACGGVRLVWALMEGRHNVGLIVVFAVIGPVLLLILCHPRRLTARGQTWLKRAQQAYAQSGRSAEPAVLTVALLGMTVLVGSNFADVRQLFGQSASSSGGCSSGCSSGDGSSCGSGCGGGGCGGGGD